MKNIAVLVSGSGTNLAAIIDAVSTGVISHGRIALVLSSSPDAYALVRAENAGIERAVVCHTSYTDRAEFTHAVVGKLREYDIDLCVLAGFMYILSPEFITSFKNAVINIHPALIPSFCGDGFYGLRVHRAALDYGVKLTGATAHFVNEITDGGE
ncbi:MAG: phosphoribosylglycinamide formyltransferase, partial [Eubacteriales bacterium]